MSHETTPEASAVKLAIHAGSFRDTDKGYLTAPPFITDCNFPALIEAVVRQSNPDVLKIDFGRTMPWPSLKWLHRTKDGREYQVEVRYTRAA